MLGENSHHPLGELAVDAEVGREHLDAMRLAHALYFEVRRPHRDAETLGLARARHDAPVVI